MPDRHDIRLRRSARSATALVAVGLAAATAATSAAQTPMPAPAEKTLHAVNLTANLKIKPVGGAFVGTGAATGTPFGAGRGKLSSTVESHSPVRTASTFTIVTTKGKVVFKGPGHYVGTTFKATMRVFSGTGRYHGATGSNLAITLVSRSGVDRLRMKGNVRY